ncbi:pyridoxamine 5'-phosphate oxidase family protein [Natronosporangium hydrolyticum]|uniref:pyridoxamine 5'-phosphate oxidase family protein n=1 Tax=Natronosporangium hydrolyticum TaxID=2811111 RepID=UPI001EFA25B4|nr:pyridoxamine 5'-phosphate oxidase family protein [Natronosporangium hydrolyticum]
MELGRAIHAAAVAELVWLGAPGEAPPAIPVTPLLFKGEPAVAFPYADLARARRVAGAAQAALVLSDDRMTGSGWWPLTVCGRPRLVEDPAGEVFADELLDQELRKYPPARVLIDSPLLRREHWWYMPRLIVVLGEPVVRSVGVRAGGAGEVFAVAGPGGLRVDTVRRLTDEAGELDLLSLAGTGVPGGRGAGAGPAVLLGHDFSVPDLERWTPWLTSGWWSGELMRVERRPEQVELAPAPGIWARWRRQRRLERACRASLPPIG